MSRFKDWPHETQITTIIASAIVFIILSIITGIVVYGMFVPKTSAIATCAADKHARDSTFCMELLSKMTSNPNDSANKF